MFTPVIGLSLAFAMRVEKLRQSAINHALTVVRYLNPNMARAEMALQTISYRAEWAMGRFTHFEDVHGDAPGAYRVYLSKNELDALRKLHIEVRYLLAAQKQLQENDPR